jgi:hypothetical protein
MAVKKWWSEDVKGKWRNITDIPKHKLLQYRQTEHRFVFSNDHMFQANKTVVKPPLQKL